MIDANKLQVLQEVLTRAPLSRAELIIVQEIIDWLMAQVKPAGEGEK
jgi:hypothetical protein